MKRLASPLILCLLLLFYACESAMDYSSADDDGTLLVNLDISVTLSDVSNALTRATGDDDAAAGDNEKMHTLRIVIVRPNGVVEANRLIDLKTAAGLESPEMEPFRVAGNERKWIYLFVNEDTKITTPNTRIERKLVNFDFHKIQVGGYFPLTAIDTLQIRLESNTEQIKGPLPMSERHEFFVKKVEKEEDREQSCRLFVTRAAVKFTFRIHNESSNAITFNGLQINGMARAEWYIPRAKYNEPVEGKPREIIDYQVPLGLGYYTYGNDQFNENKTIGSHAKEELPSIYFLEGKYTDAPNSGVYSIRIGIDGEEKDFTFPKWNELSPLPRNTHVVVNITRDKDTKVTCEVNVIPYSEVPLDPDFGL